MSIYIGIDPGVSGAVAILGPSVELHDAPVRKVKGGNQYLPAEMAAILRPYAHQRPYALLEVARPPMRAPGQGSGNISAAFRIGEGYGLWVGVLAALGIPYELIAASVWKKGIGLVAGADKKASRALAQQLFPHSAGELGKRRPDFAEALLLAETARRRVGGGA